MYTTFIYAGILITGYVLSSVMYYALRPKIKGWQGERKVNSALNRLQRKGLGKSIKDLTLLTKEGISTQIDNIFINRSGVFVIETKNYSGYITGGEYDSKWKQYIGNKEYPISNFARQNNNHISAVKYILSQYPSVPVHSFLSFNPNCSLNLDLKNTTITKYNTLAKEIKSHSKIDVLSVQQVADIYNTLNLEKEKNSISKTHVTRLNLQKEATVHARNMHMSREQYNDMLIEKYKQQAIPISETKNIESIIDNASKRSSQNHATHRDYYRREK